MLWDKVPFLFGSHILNSSEAHPYIKIFSGNKKCNDHVMHYIAYIEVLLRISYVIHFLMACGMLMERKLAGRPGWKTRKDWCRCDCDSSIMTCVGGGGASWGPLSPPRRLRHPRVQRTFVNEQQGAEQIGGIAFSLPNQKKEDCESVVRVTAMRDYRSCSRVCVGTPSQAQPQNPTKNLICLAC